jgi:hypothetical protein
LVVTVPDTWANEAKLLRLKGDNGRPNDNMRMHILSPNPQHHSALTDFTKFLASGLPGRKAIIIYGYDHPTLSMDLAIDALELLARHRVRLVNRATAQFDGLVHPVHQCGRVFGWEIADRMD